MKPDLTTAKTRHIVGFIILAYAAVIFATTDKNVDVWVYLGGYMLTVGVVKAFSKGGI